MMMMMNPLVRVFLAVAWLFGPELQAQSATKDPWMSLRYLEGDWEGRATGQVGEAALERKYEWVLNRRFLQVRHKSAYAPQKLNPRGELHEEWGVISYDRRRPALMMRQFHVEGFVIQLAVDTI